MRMQSIWMAAQISRDMQEIVGNRNQEVLRFQNASASHVLKKVEELQQECQQQSLQGTRAIQEIVAERSGFAEELDTVKRSLQSLDLKVEGLVETFQDKIANAQAVLSNDLDKEVEKLSGAIAFQSETMRNQLLELDDRLTSTLEDITEGLEGCKHKTKKDIRALYSGLETKLNTSSQNICKEIINELEMTRDRNFTNLEEVRNQLHDKIWISTEIIAGRLDKTKLELFSMVEKESQLVRDLYIEPTHDDTGKKQRKNFTFDFYVDNFVHRMAAARGDQVNGRAHVVNGVIPKLDTFVLSFPWYIPCPLDTSFQGFAKFTAAGAIKVYLLFGRNPNELGLAPRIGRTMSCHARVTDLSGEQDDIEVGSSDVSKKPWNETEIKTNEKMGVHLGSVSCNDIIDKNLHTSYADGSVLLRYEISIS